MATKKKTEVTEAEVQSEATVEKPKTTKKTSTKKASSKKEEPVVEETIEPVEEVKEPEAVAEPVVEVKEEPKKVEVKAKKEEKKEEVSGSFLVQVVGNNGAYSFKGPGFDFARNKVFVRNTKLTITEVKGNWGKISENNWILLGGGVVKI